MLERLSPAQRLERYHHLADAALAHYALEGATSVFIRHDAGVTCRVEARGGDERYLLKIAEPVGEGGGLGVERIRSVLVWLAALAQDTDVVVQEPVPNLGGELLSEVFFEDLCQPFYCALSAGSTVITSGAT